MDPVSIGIICIALAWGATVASDAVKKNKKENTKQLEAKYKNEADLAKINVEQEAIKLRDAEIAKLKKEKEEAAEDKERMLKRIEQLEKVVKDPNSSQQEKDDAILEIAALKRKFEELNDKEKTIDKTIKDKEKQNDESRKKINDIDSNYKNGFDIKDYLTIETAVIVGGCVIIYKLLKDKD